SSSLEQNLFFPPLNLVRQVLIFGRDNTFLCRKWSSQGKTLTLYCVVGYLVKHWRLFFANGFSGLGVLLEMNIGTAVNGFVGQLMSAFTTIALIRLKQAKNLLRRIDRNNFNLNLPLSPVLLHTFTQYHSQTVVLIFGSNKLFGGFILGFIASQLPINGYYSLLIVMGRFNAMATFIITTIVSIQLIVITFTQYHSQTVVLIFGSNKLLGGFILGFIATQLPLNSYYSLLILMGRFNAMATFVLTCIIVIQLVVIVGLHALAALFSFAIKSFAGRAYSWSSGSFGGKGIDLKVSLRLALYIERYDTANKRYGLTYGKISLGVISFASFGKFLLIYVLLFRRDSTFLCKKWSPHKGTSTMVLFRRYQILFKLFYKSIIYFIFIVNFHYEFCVVGYLARYWKRFFQNGFRGVFYLLVLHFNHLGILLEVNIGMAVNGLVGQLIKQKTF
ncbi:hypothetical protein TYRP_015965, partial [Tyrophagus putrescentiae]